MDSRENKPIEIVVKTGETPVIPAPNPIAKQLIAKANPKKMDSLIEITLSLFTSAKSEREITESFEATLIYFVKNFIEKESSIHFIPMQMMIKPPTKLAMPIEIKREINFPARIERYAHIMETIAIDKLETNGILVDFKPYETLIPKLSKFAEIPINNIDNKCIFSPL